VGERHRERQRTWLWLVAPSAFLTSWRSVSPDFIANGIATDADGNLYPVGDRSDSVGNLIGVVQKYDNDGVFLTEFGSDALNPAPFAIALGANGRVFVADEFGRIVEFGSDGTLVTAGDTMGLGGRWVAVDRCGNVLVTTLVDGRGVISKFTADGHLMITWSARAPGDTTFVGAEGIAVDGSGNVLIIDPDDAAVKKFGCACTPYCGGHATVMTGVRETWRSLGRVTRTSLPSMVGARAVRQAGMERRDAFQREVNRRMPDASEWRTPELVMTAVLRAGARLTTFTARRSLETLKTERASASGSRRCSCRLAAFIVKSAPSGR